MEIAENINEIRSKLPDNVKLIAVSKTKPIDDILEAYHAGQRVFGENKVQELAAKFESLPKDIEWHMIGHLQTNKVKFIVPFVSLIHGVDSLKLLEVIDKEAQKIGRTVNCLLQFHIACEETKFGFSLEEAVAMLKSSEFAELKHISLCGVMGMATFTDNIGQIRNEFRRLREIFGQLKTGYFQNSLQFREISMGMSDDYLIAIEEGSTLVRIGSRIFGSRVILK